MNRGKRLATWLIVICAAIANLFAGGGGLNVVVVVNQNSTNSLQLGNYYCEKRGVPPQNVLRINWAGGNTDWTRTNLDAVLRAPLNAMLASRQLSNQIDYILLSMDIPYRTTEDTGMSVSSGVNATTAALFYGFKLDGCNNNCPADLPSCNLPAGSSNAFVGSECVFRQTPPISATSNSWLVMMLTSSNLAQAKALVDRGVASDGTFPTQTVSLAKSYDFNRNVRYVGFDNAVFNTLLRGDYSMQTTNTYYTFGLGTMLGFQNGVQSFKIYGDFVPGAMADNLTSYSGDLFGSSDHTRVLDFINAGATASYGTVVEPCNYLEKFPASQNYFYQARGFSIAECYYQSLTNPYQGILVGEPLAAPFALGCNGGWVNLPANALLDGTTNLALQFTAVDAEHPVRQVDLFVDGLFARTLTNLPPCTNNLLYVTITGFPTNYIVPAGATLKSVVSNLTAILNTSSYSNATKVAAFAHGDRIELQSLDMTTPGDQSSLIVSNYAGTAPRLTTFLTASRTNFLDTIAFGRREFDVAGQLVLGDYLNLTVTRTNGLVATVSITNQPPAETNFNIFLGSLITAINAEPTLQQADGLVAEDLVTGTTGGGDPIAQFNLRARSPGIKESQIQAILEGSFTITPTNTAGLDENLNDLQPRNHIYVTAGVTNLLLTFGLDTTTQADGFHELTAVAYEGSHVRTQKRVSQSIRIVNTPLAATFNCLLCDTNSALEATLQFGVVANTITISRIELFSTGGSWGVVSNSSSATFSLAATNLGPGLHPFYAIVTRNDGKQYRTETKWIRLLGDEPPFALGIAGNAPTVSWPATAGRRYEILSAVNPTTVFTIRDAITPTNSPGQWSETNNASNSRLYRVHSAP